MAKYSGIGGRLYRGETSYDFIGKRRRWYGFSILLIVPGSSALQWRTSVICPHQFLVYRTNTHHPIAAIRQFQPEKHLDSIQSAARNNYFTESQAQALQDARFREDYARRIAESEEGIAITSGGRDLEALRYAQLQAYIGERFANSPVAKFAKQTAVAGVQLLGVKAESAAARAGLGPEFAQEFEQSRERGMGMKFELRAQTLPKALEGSISSLNAASKNLENASRGGPTLAAPNEDR
jgi:hypothetical protein